MSLSAFIEAWSAFEIWPFYSAHAQTDAQGLTFCSVLQLWIYMGVVFFPSLPALRLIDFHYEDFDCDCACFTLLPFGVREHA